MPTDIVQPQSAPAEPYRSVNFFGDIVCGVASLLGLAVDDVGPALARSITDRVNSWVRKGWEYWPWLELLITEERAFRETFAPELAYSDGDEVYFEDDKTYCRALEDTSAGESPEDEPDKWESFTPVVRSIGLTQFGRRSIGQIIGVYPYDPRPLGKRARTIAFTKSGGGIALDTFGTTAWITYRPQQPVFISTEYDPTVAYAAAQLVYDPTTGDCFRALDAGTGQEISEQQHWYRQSFPYLLAEYVKNGVASDLAESRGQKADFRNDAEEAIGMEIDHESEQSAYDPPRRSCWSGIPAAIIVPLPTGALIEA